MHVLEEAADGKRLGRVHSQKVRCWYSTVSVFFQPNTYNADTATWGSRLFKILCKQLHFKPDNSIVTVLLQSCFINAV